MAGRKKLILLTILAAVLFLCMVFAIRIYGTASAIGSGIGEITGKLVGTATGSVKGYEDGKKDGEEAGLSAEDTTAEIEGALESIGKLEVLVARVTLKNMSKIGDSYKGLSLISGDAVFTVDLNQAEISYSKDTIKITILIPTPELNLFLDQRSTEKLAETQKFSWSTTAEDGVNAYLNTMTQTVENVKDSMANYDSLMSSAKEAAKNQVEQLAAALCGPNQSVQVSFK